MADTLGWLKKLLGIHRVLNEDGDVLPSTHTLSFEDSGIAATYNTSEGIIELSSPVKVLSTGDTEVNDVIGAGDTAVYPVGCTGATAGDLPLADFGASGLPLGIIFGGAWCSGNTVNVQLFNYTGAGVTMTDQPINVGAVRP